MVAVFGAMSLTNPAFAAVGAPADAELAERTFSPQDTPEDFTATGAHNSVMLAWEDDGDATGWNVSVMRTGAGESWQPFPSATNNTAVTSGPYSFTLGDSDPTAAEGGVVSGLTNGDEYCFRVQVDTTDGISSIAGPVCATPMATPEQAEELEAEAGDGQVTLEWDEPGDDDIDVWQVIYGEEASAPSDRSATALNAMDDWKDIPGSESDTDEYTVTGLKRATEYWFAVRALNGQTMSLPVTADDNPSNLYVVATTTGTAADPSEPGDHTAISVKATGSDPGENPRYTLVFTSGKPLSTGTGSFTVKMEDFGVPSSIDESDITMKITGGLSTCPTALADGACPDFTATPTDGFPLADQSAHPETVTVDGSKIILTVPDFGDDADGDQGILVGDTVTVIIGQDAGITNPTEGGKSTPGKAYPWEVDGVASEDKDSVMVPIVIGIDVDDNEAGRGETVTLTGEGYKSGTTLTFWRDANGNGVKDGGEAELCDADVGSDDTASCSFDVNKPPFAPGTYGSGANDGCGAFTDDDEDMTGSMVQNCNLINGVDGRDNTITVSRDDDGIMDDDGDIKDYAIILVPSLSASPTAANPGETVLLQLKDFEPGTIAQGGVTLASEPVIASATIPASGDLNISIIIPNDVPEGKQSLKLVSTLAADTDKTVTKRVTLDIGGPIIRATPNTVVPNQRISLVGTGFSRDAEELVSITIGGEIIDDSRINGGEGVDSVKVDNGGNWSTSVDLPLTSATTAEGTREIRVRDDRDREGSILVTFPARKVTITPEKGRVGTQAVVRGENFPGKNDEGSSYSIQVVYDAGGGRTTTVSGDPNSNGGFEEQLRIPTGAGIPSTNTVRVEFRDDDGIRVVTTVTHEVPEGVVSLDTTSGPPGTAVKVSGDGFKAFVPVKSVKVGSLEVTPSPRPSTDDQGMLDFNIVIPGLDNGIQTIEVQVGDTTSSTGFTVSPSGVSSGDITESSKAVENMGDNFVRAFNFNNDTKTWSFYDPAAGDANTLDEFITGESYWILIMATDASVILNNKTRNLTCVDGNCWNLVVW